MQRSGGGLELTISFNPNSINWPTSGETVRGDNTWADNPGLIPGAFRQLEQILNGLGLNQDPLDYDLRTVHFTRDVFFNDAERGNEAVTAFLRFLSWSRRGQRRDTRDFAVSDTEIAFWNDQIERQERHEKPASSQDFGKTSTGSTMTGFNHSYKSYGWTCYNKNLERRRTQAKGTKSEAVDMESELGYRLRLELKLKTKEVIQRKLLFSTPRQLIDFALGNPVNHEVHLVEKAKEKRRQENDWGAAPDAIPAYYGDIERWFDRQLRRDFFDIPSPYTRQLPKVADTFLQHLLEAEISPPLRSHQKKLLGNLRASRGIHARQIQPLLSVLNGLGAEGLRTVLREAYRLDHKTGNPQQDAVRRSQHNHTTEVFKRLREMGTWNEDLLWPKDTLWPDVRQDVQAVILCNPALEIDQTPPA